MTLKDIAIFKHFIADRDLRRPFITVYNKSKAWAKLPSKIEEYLSNVEPLAVITKAARIIRPNDTYGYDFWQELNEDWKEYYKKMLSSSFYNANDQLINVNGYYNILRENWNDSTKPWRFESLNEACKRLGLIPIESPEEPSIDTQEEKTESDSDDLDIEFIDISATPQRKANALQKGIASINIRTSSGKIGINRIDAKDITDKGLKFAQVGRIPSGGIVIQFNNNSKAVPVLYVDGYCNINSKNMVEKVRGLLEISSELEYVRIEKIAEKMDSITYKLIKQ